MDSLNAIESEKSDLVWSNDIRLSGHRLTVTICQCKFLIARLANVAMVMAPGVVENRWYVGSRFWMKLMDRGWSRYVRLIEYSCREDPVKHGSFSTFWLFEVEGTDPHDG